ncbi:hypothetical protein ACSBR1_003576 [Camellia fascicularis]
MVIARCKWNEETSCEWFIHGVKKKANRFFVIKKFVSLLSCGVAYRTSSNSRLSSNSIVGEIVDIVGSNPLKRPVKVLSDFRENYGLSIMYDHAWAAVDKAKSLAFGDHKLSFDQLDWYGKELFSRNSGSKFVVDYCTETRHFCQLFVAFNACIQGFNSCRPILFLDGTFLKGRFRGTLLCATLNDANQGLFSSAFSVVDRENLDS